MRPAESKVGDEFEVGGYYVVDSWGNIERTTLSLQRRPDGTWICDDVEVFFLEAHDLPAEEDRGGWDYRLAGRTIHRPDRENRIGVVVQARADTAPFVLDDDAVATLVREGAYIEPLPPFSETVVMPAEATEEMIDAALRAMNPREARLIRNQMRVYYRAMLQAYLSDDE